MIESDIIHTPDKATINSIVLAMKSHHHSSEVEYVILKIENIVETGGCAVDTMLAVHRYLGAVAMPFQFDYMPFAVIDFYIIQPYLTFTAAEIKSKLHISLDNLQNTKVNKSAGIQQGCHAVPGLKSNGDTHMPFH